MKVLVLPDIHGRKFWRKTLADNIGQVDKVIFLGDYLDPYQKEIYIFYKAKEQKQNLDLSCLDQR